MKKKAVRREPHKLLLRRETLLRLAGQDGSGVGPSDPAGPSQYVSCHGTCLGACTTGCGGGVASDLCNLSQLPAVCVTTIPMG